MKKYLVIAKWTLSVDRKIRLLGDKFEVDEETLVTLNPELIEIVEELSVDNKDDKEAEEVQAEEVQADEVQAEVKPKRKGKKQVKGGNNDTDTTETD